MQALSKIALIGCLTVAWAIGHAEPSISGARGGGTTGLKYSKLNQITSENIGSLEQVWTYRTGELVNQRKDVSDKLALEATPILVNGLLTFCTPLGRAIALDPATGVERWVFDPKLPDSNKLIGVRKCRGVAQWTDEQAPPGQPCKTRVIYGAADLRVFALDGATGKPCADFADHGALRFLPEKPIAVPGEVSFGSPPTIIGDIAVFGSSVVDSYRSDAVSGKVRAIDVRSGRLAWEFDPIPRDPKDPVAGTWGNGSASTAGAANVWSLMSSDAERDLIFLPTSSPSPDYYGALRPGENRYANSLVALRGRTGEVVWHFQISHHDLWDYDLPAQPILATLDRDGQRVPVVIQLTKQGLVFVFHRETGEPYFRIEERPVPKGDIPGEWYSPTQPFPVAPPPLLTQGIEPEDAWGMFYFDRVSCRKKIAALRHGPLYTPPSVVGTVLSPSYAGGVNWGGGAVDEQHGLLIVSTLNVPGVVRLIPRSTSTGAGVDAENFSRAMVLPQKGTPYSVAFEFLLSPLGVPCTAPPWGQLTAVDLQSGRIKWQVPLGSIEKFLPVPLSVEWGTPSAGGPIVTAGKLVFIAATLDDKFRAFDLQTGKKVWEVKLPAGGQATPMTYAVDGRQFIVIAAGGHPIYNTTRGDYVIAYALKKK